MATPRRDTEGTPVLGAPALVPPALVVDAAQTAPSNWKAPTEGQVSGRVTPRASVVTPSTAPPAEIAGLPARSARVGTAPPLSSNTPSVEIILPISCLSPV